MDKSVNKLALIFAIQAEIEGMKIENIKRKILDESPAYSENDFFLKSDELRKIASM